jgi:hypothetical protein
VNKDTEFRFYADGFYSDDYLLKTLPAPLLSEFDTKIDYPSYTGRSDESLSNTGDLVVPAGTGIKWLFKTINTDQIELRFKDSTHVLTAETADRFSSTYRAMESNAYSIHSSNEFMSSRDSILYRINVIPDMYPMINVSEEQDSLLKKHLYFTGDIKDDYGFRKLTFNYMLEYSEEDQSRSSEMKSVEIAVNKSSSVDQFYYHWNLSDLGVLPGDQFSYFFEIWDNDGVNGSKSSRTQTRSYSAPTLDDILEERDQKNEDLKDDLEESIKDAKDIQKDLEQLRKDLLEKEELSWQDRKKIEDLLKKQQDLRNQVENIQEKNAEKNQQQEEYQQMDEKLMEKQQMLQDLMDEVMTDEMKEMMEKIQEMMEKMDMEQIQEEIEDMDMSTEDMEKELDRVLEQFKQLEWELKMEEAIDDLEKLAEEQEKLSEESEKEENKSEDLLEKQEELNKEFEEWKKEMEEVEEMNEELEEPNAMPENSDEEKSIDEDMEESSEQLEKDKKSKASGSQKSASEKMKEMAQKMDMMMQQQESDSMEEDMESLRALLENIITLSFDQEDLMSDLKVIDNKDPKYVNYAQTQRKLKDDAKMVEDSLFALSKRIIQLQAPVNREITLVNENMSSSLEEMGERRTDKVTMHQQYVMTSFNNLALLLDEALQQLQKECSGGKPGKGNCEKPGGSGSKPSAGKMKKAQEALSKQLEEMKKAMEGSNQGKNKDGMSPMSKELANMAAKQGAIRRQMEKMGQMLNEDGSGNGNELKQIAKEMEELEKDLVNKEINQETLKRQQDILIRLLKAENAERQRELDNQRKSNEAREELISNPMKYSDYQKRKEKEIEMLKTLPPALTPHYKEKVNNYFNKLGD